MGRRQRAEFYESGTRRRTGERTFVAEQIDKESLGFKTLSKSAIPVVRSRSINLLQVVCDLLLEFMRF